MLAKQLGLSVSTFSDYLTEKRQDNLATSSENLGRYQQISRDWLYVGEGQMVPDGSVSKTELEKNLLRRVADLEAEQQEQKRFISKLETRLLLDGARDKDGAPSIGKAVRG